MLKCNVSIQNHQYKTKTAIAEITVNVIIM